MISAFPFGFIGAQTGVKGNKHQFVMLFLVKSINVLEYVMSTKIVLVSEEHHDNT
jgi:hypothetical protein